MEDQQTQLNFLQEIKKDSGTHCPFY